MATIYSSLLDFANLSDTTNTNGSVGKGIGELFLRTAIAAGLILPLLALTIVLMMRVGFLRCIIAASPIIVLATVFKKDIKLPGNLAKQADPMNIVKAIFAPVITVFALSISLVFMTALITTFKPKDTAGQKSLLAALSSIGVVQTKGASDDSYDTLNIMGTVIQYDKSLNGYAGATGDRFSWMILCCSGIGMMRFIMFAAFKASGTI